MTAQVIDFKTRKALGWTHDDTSNAPAAPADADTSNEPCMIKGSAIEAKAAGQVLVDAIEELEAMLTQFKFDVIAQPYSISDELHCHLEHMDVLQEKIGHETCNFHSKAYAAYCNGETNPQNTQTQIETE